MFQPDRVIVYWFGRPPTPDELIEYQRRNLRVVAVAQDAPRPNFRYARAAVFCVKPPSVRATFDQLDLVNMALNHGLLVYLVVGDDATLAELRHQVAPTALTHEAMRTRTGEMPAHEAAEWIARHNPGPRAEPTLEIQHPPDVALDDDSRLLLTRAFGDCVRIILQPLSGGRSANAYAVQATLRASQVGPRPMPFFAKLDTAHKVITERTNYELYASLHIPWYLRPNLDPRRCLVGLDKGVLVGSFVVQSESLWKVVLEGRGPRYIHALFEETLMGWRSQAYQNNAATGCLAAKLDKVFRWQRVLGRHVEAAREFGDVRSPRDLWLTLLDLPKQTWREAPMHGDLHAENVRVRGDDAIIIDLAKVAVGPLCADLASLEVWLSFEVPPGSTTDRVVWTNLVKELFARNAVARPPSLASRHDQLDWLRACVRQTRMISTAVCECNTEYAVSLAVHLLRRACYERKQGSESYLEEDAFRRAYAYYLGSGLVESLAAVPAGCV